VRAASTLTRSLWHGVVPRKPSRVRPASVDPLPVQHVAVKRSRSAPDGPLTIGRHSFYRTARVVIPDISASMACSAARTRS